MRRKKKWWDEKEDCFSSLILNPKRNKWAKEARRERGWGGSLGGRRKQKELDKGETAGKEDHR